MIFEARVSVILAQDSELRQHGVVAMQSGRFAFFTLSHEPQLTLWNPAAAFSLAAQT